MPTHQASRTGDAGFFTHHGLWAVGVRLFRMLGFRAKALVISTTFLIPLMLVSVIYLRDHRAQEQFSLTELQGVAALQAYMPVMQALVSVRNAQRAMLGGFDSTEAFRQSNAAMDRALAGFGDQLQRSGDPLAVAGGLAKLRESYTKAVEASRSTSAQGRTTFGPVAEAAKALQQDLADKSNLTLDPVIDSFFLQAGLVMVFPDLVENVGQLWGWSTFLAAKGGAADPKALRRYVTWDHMAGHLGATLADHFKRAGDATPSLRAGLDLKVLAPVADFQKLAERSVLEGGKTDPAVLWSQGQKAVEALFEMPRRGLPMLERLIADRVAQLRLERHLVLVALVVCLLAAAYLFYSFYLVMHGGLAEVRRHLESMTEGDLTTVPRPWGRDEAAALMQSLGTMQESLRAIVGKVRGASDSIVMASNDVASASLDLSSRTEETAANLQQSAASMEQIAATVNHTSEATSQASSLAATNAQVARRGQQVIGDVIHTMQDIQDASRKIGEIIAVIDGIAFQTNILALNAAVEAARAGEQGRGFAVVASEVRGLAQRSASAAREIRVLITGSVERVDSGTQVVQGAGATMQELLDNAGRIDQLLSEIAAAARQQTSGVTQVGASVQQLDRMTQQNAALVEESSAAAASLRDQAEDLARRVAGFRLPGTA